MKIKNIIFDLGGVLIDWDPRYMYRKHFTSEAQMEWFLENICTPEWNVQQDAGRTLAEGTDILINLFPDQEKMIRKYYGKWEEMLNGEIIENVRLLDPLKEKYRLFGLTNWSAETFTVAQDRFDFLNLFEGIVVSGIEKMIKPNPSIYDLLLARYDLKADESLFIDDNALNIHVARARGIKSIYFDGTVSLVSTFEKMGIL